MIRKSIKIIKFSSAVSWRAWSACSNDWRAQRLFAGLAVLHVTDASCVLAYLQPPGTLQRVRALPRAYRYLKYGAPGGQNPS